MEMDTVPFGKYTNSYLFAEYKEVMNGSTISLSEIRKEILDVQQGLIGAPESTTWYLLGNCTFLYLLLNGYKIDY